jgi:hypothetical protein
MPLRNRSFWLVYASETDHGMARRPSSSSGGRDTVYVKHTVSKSQFHAYLNPDNQHPTATGPSAPRSTARPAGDAAAVSQANEQDSPHEHKEDRKKKVCSLREK